MRARIILVIILLSLSFCFVSGVGYGEVYDFGDPLGPLVMYFRLLQARIDYIMQNPTNFLDVGLHYDIEGEFSEEGFFPQGVETEGKVVVTLQDNRGIFFNRIKEEDLLRRFQQELTEVYTFLEPVATEMDDIVAIFYNQKGLPLGYYYGGSYKLQKG